MSLSKQHGFAIIESDTFETDVQSMNEDEVRALLKWHDERLNELFDAGCESRDWTWSCDGFDYMMQGAIAAGADFFERVLADEDVPFENEGAITYPLYDRAEQLGVDP